MFLRAAGRQQFHVLVQVINADMRCVLPYDRSPLHHTTESSYHGVTRLIQSPLCSHPAGAWPVPEQNPRETKPQGAAAVPFATRKLSPGAT